MIEVQQYFALLFVTYACKCLAIKISISISRYIYDVALKRHEKWQ